MLVRGGTRVNEAADMSTSVIDARRGNPAALNRHRLRHMKDRHDPMPPSLDRLRRRLSTNPFTIWLGLSLTDVTDSAVAFSCPWRDEFLGNAGREAIHGGIYAAMIDSAAIYAVIVGLGRMATTIDLRIDFHAKARRGVFTIVGSPVRIGRTMSTAEARVLDCEGRLVASGRGVFMALQESLESDVDSGAG